MKTEKLLDAIGEVDARFIEEAAQTKQVIRRHLKRNVLLCAAAAALLLTGAAAVGAAERVRYAEGGYAELFGQFFSDRSESETAFDFTGMGKDIDETLSFAGGQVHVRSVAAEAAKAYVIYDVVFDAETELPEDLSLLITGTDAEVRQNGKEIMQLASGSSRMLEVSGARSCTFYSVFDFEGEGTLADGGMEIEFIEVLWHTEEDSVRIPMNVRCTVDMSDLAHRPMLETSQTVPLENWPGVNVTHAKLSAFTLALHMNGRVQSMQDTSLRGCVYAIHHNGTMTALDFDMYSMNTDDETHTDAVINADLTRPVTTQDIAAILFDGTEIPLTEDYESRLAGRTVYDRTMALPAADDRQGIITEIRLTPLELEIMLHDYRKDCKDWEEEFAQGMYLVYEDGTQEEVPFIAHSLETVYDPAYQDAGLRYRTGFTSPVETERIRSVIFYGTKIPLE